MKEGKNDESIIAYLKPLAYNTSYTSLEPRCHSATTSDKHAIYSFGLSSPTNHSNYVYKWELDKDGKQTYKMLYEIPMLNCQPQRGTLSLMPNGNLIYLGEKSPQNMYCVQFLAIHFNIKFKTDPLIINISNQVRMEPVQHFITITYFDPLKERHVLLMHGGHQMHQLAVSDEMYCYDPLEREFTLHARTGITLYNHIGFLYNRHSIIMMSGVDDNMDINNVTYLYDIPTNTFERIETFGKQPFDIDAQSSTVVHDDYLYCYALNNDNESSSSSESDDEDIAYSEFCGLFRLHIPTKMWCELQLIGPPPPFPRIGHSLCFIQHPYTKMDTLISLFGFSLCSNSPIEHDEVHYSIELPHCTITESFQSNLQNNIVFQDCIIEFS
mmetsp:Transcript_254/g.465  ORF Transcript_254/g.465 Transcript_254/m.465 type:complete len:383 (+) Transcript_254:70-1218(+)